MWEVLSSWNLWLVDSVLFTIREVVILHVKPHWKVTAPVSGNPLPMNRLGTYYVGPWNVREVISNLGITKFVIYGTSHLSSIVACILHWHAVRRCHRDVRMRNTSHSYLNSLGSLTGERWFPGRWYVEAAIPRWGTARIGCLTISGIIWVIDVDYDIVIYRCIPLLSIISCRCRGF